MVLGSAVVVADDTAVCEESYSTLHLHSTPTVSRKLAASIEHLPFAFPKQRRRSAAQEQEQKYM